MQLSKAEKAAVNDDKTDLVVKSNRLVEASYRLSLTEQQMILYSIVQCRDEQCGLSADKPVTIVATDFARRFGLDDSNVHRQLKEATATLYERDVRIHDTDPNTGKPRVVNTRWISDRAYIDGAGRVEITFAPRMIPFITRLESEFTSYRLEKIGNMSSIHAVRLYELLVQYLSIGSREIEIAWLKTTLCIADEYKAIKDLKKRVIDVAIDQINEHSDIQVTYTQRKTGRAVTHLIFSIKAKEPPKPKTVNQKKKSLEITREVIEKFARPGETYEAAEKRLKENPPAEK
jgi:plasmid replication initiation protein